MELVGGTFLLALRLIGVGWIWNWASDDSARKSGSGAFLWSAGRAVAAGLLLNLLPLLFLAALGIWTPGWDWTLWAILVAFGILRARRRGCDFRRAAARGLAALLLTWGLGSVSLLSAPRSEWLAGGWDPGIYQNEAVVLARTGDLRGNPTSIYAAMTPAEREIFSEAENSYRETFPSVPIRIADGSLPLYSFQLTPVCGAWFLRLGGLGLLMRMPAILAAWGLLPALALFGLVGMGSWRRWVGLGLWLLSPAWWYHQAIPTAEMLYLLLLLGGLLFYLRAFLDRARISLGVVCTLFAATVNHPNVAVLASGLLLVAAAAEGNLRAPGRWGRVLPGFAAIGLALAWNGWFSGLTMLRLEEKDHALRLMLAAWAAGGLASIPLLWRPLPSALKAWGLRVLQGGCAVAGAGLAAVALAASFARGHSALIKTAIWISGVGGAVLDHLVRLTPFHGMLALAWAGIGMVWLALRRDSVRPVLKTLVFALGAVFLFLLASPGIAAIYPWALRRYVVYLVPLLALIQTETAVCWIEGLRGPGRRWRWLAFLLFLPALVQGARLSVAAARVGDYPGLSQVLGALEQAADPRAVIVADDPRWGTPLLRAGGREVINGRPLWQSRDPEFQRRFLTGLQRVRERTGRPLLWLTSTAKGLDLYPVELDGVSAPLAEIPYAYHVVVHSARAAQYAVTPQRREFRLQEWNGTGWPRGESVLGYGIDREDEVHK